MTVGQKRSIASRRGMQLRTKIALIASGALLAVALVLVGFAEVRQQWVEQRYDEAVLSGDRTALTTLREIDERALSRANWDIRDRPTTRALLGFASESRIAEFTTEVQNLLRFQDPRPDVILLDTEFNTVASVGTIDLGDRSTLLSSSFDGTRRNTSGLYTVNNAQLVFLFAHEIRVRDTVAGYLVTALDYGERLTILAGEATSIVFVPPIGSSVSLAGRIPGGVRPLLTCCRSTQDVVRLSAGASHTVGSATPLSDLLGRSLGDVYILRDISAARSQQILFSRLSFAGVVMLATMAVALLMWLLRTSFRPLNAVVEVLRNLSDGNTSVGLKPIRTNREIGILAETVESFRKAQTARLALVSLNEQIASAARIQRSILPATFDIDPNLDVYAAMRAAQDVGGDFYDVFLTGAGKPAFVVADVAGKGIGSALFAATASAMIRAYAQVSSDPSEIVTWVNRELCRRNEEGLFLTLFLAVYDSEERLLRYTNAGHPPPFLIVEDGISDLPPEFGDLVVGALDETDYTTHQHPLGTGEMLLVYSDGLNEAMSEAGDILGTEAAREMAPRGPETNAEDAVEALMRGVIDYSGDNGLADDVTLVAFSLRSGL